VCLQFEGYNPMVEELGGLFRPTVGCTFGIFVLWRSLNMNNESKDSSRKHKEDKKLTLNSVILKRRSPLQVSVGLLL
jgi:hypothetical protein